MRITDTKIIQGHMKKDYVLEKIKIHCLILIFIELFSPENKIILE